MPIAKVCNKKTLKAKLSDFGTFIRGHMDVIFDFDGVVYEARIYPDNTVQEAKTVATDIRGDDIHEVLDPNSFDAVFDI